MGILTFEDFKQFVISLITAIVTKLDAAAAADKAKIDQLSADLTAANNSVQELQVALVAKDADKAEALVAQAAQQIASLDAFATELSIKFNPTPGTDAVAEVVKESDNVETPSEVAESTEVGTGEATPSDVADAAAEAIADAAADALVI